MTGGMERIAEGDELVLVFDGPLVQAQRVQSMLGGHGILAALLDQYVALGYGMFGVRVAVRARELAAAREVLAASGLLR